MRKNISSISKQGKIVIYSPKNEKLRVEVQVSHENIWLTQKMIADLFQTERSVITKHIGNIFKSKELLKRSVCANFAHTAPDGKIYQTDFYNLDAIISVGYRVNSKRATQFRIWATNKLKKYLIQGYAINEKRLLEQKNKFLELQKTINFIKNKSKAELLAGRGFEILSLLDEYSKALRLLEEYDSNRLKTQSKKKSKFVLKYDDAKKIIFEIKKSQLIQHLEANLFGIENAQKFGSILGAIYQTYDKTDLYPSIEEKAAHLLYLTIKDHPFSDGNKRIGSFLFIYFLKKHDFLLKENGERKIDENALFALAILIAISDPKEKETMIKIVTNLIS